MNRNWYAADGFRYGVRFESDGSVTNTWSGRTQRQRAEDSLRRLRETYPGDTFTLVRKDRTGGWKEVERDAEEEL